jgi:hypothetical protein
MNNSGASTVDRAAHPHMRRIAALRPPMPPRLKGLSAKAELVQQPCISVSYFKLARGVSDRQVAK